MCVVRLGSDSEPIAIGLDREGARGSARQPGGIGRTARGAEDDRSEIYSLPSESNATYRRVRFGDIESARWCTHPPPLAASVLRLLFVRSFSLSDSLPMRSIVCCKAPRRAPFRFSTFPLCHVPCTIGSAIAVALGKINCSVPLGVRLGSAGGSPPRAPAAARSSRHLPPSSPSSVLRSALLCSWPSSSAASGPSPTTLRLADRNIGSLVYRSIGPSHDSCQPLTIAGYG